MSRSRRRLLPHYHGVSCLSSGYALAVTRCVLLLASLLAVTSTAAQGAAPRADPGAEPGVASGGDPTEGSGDGAVREDRPDVPAAAEAPPPAPPPPADLPPVPAPEPLPVHRNPQGALNVSTVFGASVGGSGTQFVLGLGAGYAVFTGVMPGVRGLILVGDGLGGEIATNLTLTPPIESSITPFVVGELGRRFEPFGAGWLYGAGGGIYLGEPAASFAVQLGWMFRRIAFADPVGNVDASGPIVSLSIRF